METRETITLDAPDPAAPLVLDHVLDGTSSTAEEAGAVLELSVRQVRRLRRPASRRGAAGLVHGNRGRPPGQPASPDGLRAALVELAHDDVRRRQPRPPGGAARRARGLHGRRADAAPDPRRGRASPPSGRRRPPRHRSRRERMPRAGLLVQTDGSRHRWLGRRGPWLPWSAHRRRDRHRHRRHVPGRQEDAAGYFAMLAQTVRRLRPAGRRLLRPPRHLHHGPPAPDDRRAARPAGAALTQVGRALERGRGRLDRRPQPARPRAASSAPGARSRTAWSSSFAWPGAHDSTRRTRTWPRYLPRHNARFAVPAADHDPAWRPWPRACRSSRCSASTTRAGWPRCHGQLGSARASQLPRRRWPQLGRRVGGARGATRWQPVGSPRRAVRAGRPSAAGSRSAAGPEAVPRCGRDARPGGRGPAATGPEHNSTTQQAGARSPLARLVRSTRPVTRFTGRLTGPNPGRRQWELTFL